MLNRLPNTATVEEVSASLKEHGYVIIDAESLLEYATSRDISKVYPGKSVYATMLNVAGQALDRTVTQ